MSLLRTPGAFPQPDTADAGRIDRARTLLVIGASTVAAAACLVAAVGTALGGVA